jgi:hypothetical protein
MPSIDQTAKAQFAKVFTNADWPVFKSVADTYFERSARLRKSNMTAFPPNLRLLARNIEKRLLLGIGTELLLKAAYLRHGFAINKATRGAVGVPPFPFTAAQATAAGIVLDPNETYMLNDLIQCLHRVPAIGGLGPLEPGLRIAKVFRNKEGHAVVTSHNFDPQEYREIETALVGVYARAFGQTLTVRISMEPRQKAVWILS